MLSLLVQEIGQAIDNFKKDCRLLSLPLSSFERIDTLKLEIQESVSRYWSQQLKPPTPMDLNSRSIKRLSILTKIRALLKTKLYYSERDPQKSQTKEEIQTYLTKVEREISKLGVSCPRDTDEFNGSVFSVSATEQSFAPSYSGVQLLKNARAEGQELERKIRQKSFLLEEITSTQNQSTVDKIEATEEKPKISEGIVSPSPIDFKSKSELLNLMQLNNEELEKGSEHNYGGTEQKIEEIQNRVCDDQKQEQDGLDSSFFNTSEIYLPSLATETQNSILEEENKDMNIEIKVNILNKTEQSKPQADSTKKEQIKKTKDFLKKEPSKKEVRIPTCKSVGSKVGKGKTAQVGSVKQKVTVLQKKAPKGCGIKGGATSNKPIQLSCKNMKGLLDNLADEPDSRDSLSLLETKKRY